MSVGGEKPRVGSWSRGPLGPALTDAPVSQNLALSLQNDCWPGSAKQNHCEPLCNAGQEQREEFRDGSWGDSHTGHTLLGASLWFQEMGIFQ